MKDNQHEAKKEAKKKKEDDKAKLAKYYKENYIQQFLRLRINLSPATS